MLSVRERGETVATLRWIHVWLMETLAAWVPTTPEMEVKLLFGTHVWDVAQHADALGKRTHELRMPLQHSLKPAEAYCELLAAVASVTGTAERIHYIYHGVLPALAARYRLYLARTDTLLDAPTVRILEHLLREQERMIYDAHLLLAQLPAVRLADPTRVRGFLERETAVLDFVVHREPVVPAGA
jgi:hypothetical protein